MDNTISALATRIKDHAETIETEEAVKTSVVLPFLQGLGYDVFNPAEVVPEFTADAPGKKGEKVDYAIQKDGEVVILIECKSLNTKLEVKHMAQLFRYFSVTDARFALLTNGREYHFYTDLKQQRRLDQTPFFTFDILDNNAAGLDELKKFAKAEFDIGNILADAERLKYVSLIKSALNDWMNSPSEGFVKLVAAEVYDGRLNASVREMLLLATKSAFREIIRDRVRTRLNSALHDPEADPGEAETHSDDGIVTTEEEVEAFLIIKSILREHINSERVFMRDAKSYCAVLLDDNNRKPLARLHFNRSQKYLGLFDGEEEERVAISGLDDIFDYRSRISTTAAKYS